MGPSLTKKGNLWFVLLDPQIQVLISLRNNLSDTLRIMFDQISGQSSGQSSWHLKFTIMILEGRTVVHGIVFDETGARQELNLLHWNALKPEKNKCWSLRDMFLLRLGVKRLAMRRIHGFWAAHRTGVLCFGKVKCFQYICNVSVILNFYIGLFYCCFSWLKAK